MIRNLAPQMKPFFVCDPKLKTYIYKSTYSYPGCTEGWDLDEEGDVAEPVVDRWTEGQAFSQRRRTDAPLNLSIFTLSGGVMKPIPGRRSSDAIDEMLTHILAQPSSGSYRAGIDKNLDYLFTSLQLDMIGSIAERCFSVGAGPSRRAEMGPPERE